MRRPLPLLGLLLLVLMTGACREEGTITVNRLAFRGVAAVDESRLKAVLATRESSRLPWGRQLSFSRSRFDADLKRIEAFYADRGYPDARVTDFDVRLNDQKDAVDVTLTIAEGEPVRVASLGFVGFDSLPPRRLDALKQRAPLRIAQPRDRQLVAATHEMALNALRDQGYPYARVSTAETGGRDVTVTFTAEPGTLAHFGPVEIVGNLSVGERVIERQLTYRPGEIYRRSVVQDTQRRLYAMELFQFVNVEALAPERQDPEVRTRVTVAEGRHQRVNLGVGYGSEEKARAEGQYRHVNFLGGARAAGVRARWSSLDRGVRLDFTQPYVFNPHFSLGVETQQWYTFTPAYQSILTGGKIGLTHSTSQRSSWSVSLTSERDNSSIANDVLSDLTLRNDLIALGLDPTTGRLEGTLNALGFDFQQSTADNLLDPHRGYQLAVHTESAGQLLPGVFNYFALSVDGRHYVPLGDRLVVANRLQASSVDDRAEDGGGVPFSKKYFLGGATSLRGWGRYEVSPLSASGLPLGGNSLLALSSELRAALNGRLGGVLFIDAGNVWPGEWHMVPAELRVAAGVGVRYGTPLGPIRFDFGYQLNTVEGLLIDGAPQDRRWRVHFSIGQAF